MRPILERTLALKRKETKRVQTFKKNLGEIITDHVISMLEIPDIVTEGRPSESPADKKCGVPIKSRFTTARFSFSGRTAVCVCVCVCVRGLYALSNARIIGVICLRLRAVM